MRQSSTVESTRQAAQASGQSAPHPVLSTALSTLDIQLEEELARYRRAKAGGNKAGRSTSSRTAAKPLDLISVPAHISPAPNASAVAAGAAGMVLATGISNSSAPVPESSLLHSPQADPAPNLAEQDVELDDYLASSEELLRSLSEEEAKVQAERGFMRSLVTPLGVGSMLLLLLSSAMFGYVVTNPTSLSNLFADRNNVAQPAAEPGAIAPNTNSTDAPQPNLANKEFKDLNLNPTGTLKPGSANRSIGGTSLAQPAQKPGVIQTATPAASPTAASPTTEANAQNNSQNSQPTPAAPRLAEQPAASEPAPQPYSRSPEPDRDPAPARPVREAPAAQPAVSSRGEGEYRYKVVSPYSGDGSLAEAKKVVPDAFLTNSAGRAENQLGAYSSAADAEAQVQQLRRQGIQAEVQKR